MRIVIVSLVAALLSTAIPIEAQATKSPASKKSSPPAKAVERAQSEECRAFVAMIEKGFGANPWGTPKDELRIGTELLPLGDPRREKLEKMKFGTFEYRGRQEDSNSWSYRENGMIPPIRCLDYKDVQMAVDSRFGKFSRLVFGAIPGSERAVMGFMKELLSGRNGYREGTREFLGKYEVLHTANLEVTVDDSGGPDGVFVEVTHKYENPCPGNAGKDPSNGNPDFKCGVLGQAWGKTPEQMAREINDTSRIEGMFCKGCVHYDSVRKNIGFLGIIATEISYEFKNDKLQGATIQFYNRDFDHLATTIHKLMNVSMEKNSKYYSIHKDEIAIIMKYQSEFPGSDSQIGYLAFGNEVLMDESRE